MGVCKIIFNNNVLMDISSDSVDKNKLLKNETAHSADGEAITGDYTDKNYYIDEDGYLCLSESAVIIGQ